MFAVTRAGHPLTPSHSHGREIGDGEAHLFTTSKRPYTHCVTVHVGHLVSNQPFPQMLLTLSVELNSQMLATETSPFDYDESLAF